LAKKPDVLERIVAQAKAPLKDVSAVNATRWALHEHLTQFGVPVECGTGGRTKYNRITHNLPKTHWIDAACVGASTPDILHVSQVVPLLIKATGYGNRQMCGVNKYGFPIRHRQQQKRYFGFQTGDMVKAIVTKGKKVGTYIGRVLVRARGSFDIITQQGRVQSIGYRTCTMLYRCDGYSYQKGKSRQFLPVFLKIQGGTAAGFIP